MREATYKNYLIVVLLVILAFNYVDRLALGLLLQDIKVDLDVSDTQLGFLSGMAFAVFYSLMGIPLARWADRGNRVVIISFTTALWSVALALCGLAQSFVHLLIIRVGVAIGEAGCLPPAHSLIADHFDRAERPRAVARYMLGVPVSVVIGYFLAGWLNEFYGWRTTFLVLGLPGLPLAVLAWFTLREPRKRAGVDDSRLGMPQSDPSDPIAQPRAQSSLREVFMTLWASPSFRHLMIGFSIVFFFNQGILQWKPAFFVRSYGLTTGELGTWFTVIYGVGGILGTYLGGEWASRYAANNERLQLKAIAIAYAGFSVISTGIYLSPNLYLAFGLMTIAAVTGAATAGPMFATIQTLVPERMRATAIATIYLFANLIGMGLGPLAAGALSDVLRPLYGEESLRYALLALSPGYLWTGWHLWQASKTVATDLRIARGEDDGAGRGELRAVKLLPKASAG